MKKLVVLISVLALMAIALPVMASNVTASGELTYGFVTNGKTTGTVEGFQNAQFNLSAMVDSNNSVNLGLGLIPLTTLGAGQSWNAGANGVIQHFYLESNIGGMLGLQGVDPVLYAGLGTATLPGYGVTDYGNENIAGLGIGGEGAGMTANETTAYNLIALNTSVNKMFNILVGVAPSVFTNQNEQLVAGAYGTVGPVSLEAAYTAAGSGTGPTQLSDGTLAAGALVEYPLMSDITVSATGQIVNSMATGATNNYSAGLKVDYNKMVDAAFSLVGQYGAATGLVKSDWNVDVTPIKDAGATVAGVLNYASGATLFDTVEVSGWYAFGPAKVYVGYLTGQTGANALGIPNYNAPVGGQSGVFVKADLSF